MFIASAAVVGLVGTALCVVVPLGMLGCILFLFGSRSKTILSPVAHKLGVGMCASHFAGLALFVAANGIPVSLQPIRVLIACLAIFLIGVTPSVISVSLIKCRMIPQAVYPLGWFAAGTTVILSLSLSFIVWMADLAIKSSS